MKVPYGAAEEGVVVTESLNHEGLGVAHVDGKALFIHGALPGETVRFRYQVRKRRYDFATATAILAASPDRAVPPCPHFGVCGGCALQHMTPTAQLQAKEQILLETLQHVGKVVPERVLPALGGATAGYRRRARIGIRCVPKKGGVLVGFRERNSSYITPLGECVVLDERVSHLLPAIQALVTGLSGPSQMPQVEIATTVSQVALVFRHLAPLTVEDRALMASFAQTQHVTVYLQSKGPDSIVPLAEPVKLHYELPGNIHIEFQPTDFVQVNGPMNVALVTAAMDLLAVGPEDHIADFFCGIGNFSLPLARRAAFVAGVEGSTELVRRAQENATANGIENVRFEHLDLYQGAALERAWWNEGYSKVLLDPPRTGAMELIKTFDENKIERIVYVSCYPATLARDCEFLVHRKGYRLMAAGVVDMFPHTTHMESCALLVREAAC